MQIKVDQAHLFSNLVTWYGFLPSTSYQLDPPKNCLKDGWVLSNLEESQHSCLPSQWKSFHPVFHISLLEPVKTSTIPNMHQEPPPPIIIEDEEEWEFSQILDSKLNKGKLWYLVEWKGFSQGPERSTWEPTESLNNSPEPIRDLHYLYPDNLGPNSSKS
ncbi:hypothetical protein O181_027874 [Austropuccinia psidii MF-1]|uniref:Chromo domain-containing protein n=1 Tax=Austropuccinia psidii MF-1 TaxID=1389203 RepID=A0A9Q3CMT9_9BASI|nr:hypothetical protein [Austropuccinia psidii MF-1]